MAQDYGDEVRRWLVQAADCFGPSWNPCLDETRVVRCEDFSAGMRLINSPRLGPSIAGRHVWNRLWLWWFPWDRLLLVMSDRTVAAG